MATQATEKTVRIAALAALGAAALTLIAPHTAPFALLSAVAPIALSALAFLTGALAAAALRRLARRPALGAVALISFAPLPPFQPDAQQLALITAFAIAGLLMAGLLGPIVAAFGRERLASISGALGLGLIATIAIRAGLAVGPTMQAVLALCVITAALAMTSAILTAPRRIEC